VIESERDRAADQAYRDHANDVYRVAYGILRDPDDALDAVHASDGSIRLIAGQLGGDALNFLTPTLK